MFIRVRLLFALVGIISPSCIQANNSWSPLKVHFINVENGDATLLEYPCGTVLFDAGGKEDSSEILTNYLDAYFDRRPELSRRINLLIVSHAHFDHSGYVSEIAERYKIENLISNGHLGSKALKPVHELLKNNLVISHFAAKTESIPPGGLPFITSRQIGCSGGPVATLRILWGDVERKSVNWGAKRYKDENNHSVALLAYWGSTRTLLTGDMERESLRSMLTLHKPILENVDIYQISHHGFASGTTPEFDEHIRPRIAVLSRIASRPLLARTWGQFNALVREKRVPTTVPIFAYDGSGVVMDAFDEEVFGNVDRGNIGGREITLGSAVLSSAVYWTGRDGTIVVTVQPDGDISTQIDSSGQ